MFMEITLERALGSHIVAAVEKTRHKGDKERFEIANSNFEIVAVGGCRQIDECSRCGFGANYTWDRQVSIIIDTFATNATQI